MMTTPPSNAPRTPGQADTQYIRHTPPTPLSDAWGGDDWIMPSPTPKAVECADVVMTETREPPLLDDDGLTLRRMAQVIPSLDDVLGDYSKSMLTQPRSVPSYFRAGAGNCEFMDKLNFYSLENPCFSYKNMEDPMRQSVATILSTIHPFANNNFVDTDYFELAIQLTASLVYLLYPKEYIIGNFYYKELSEQNVRLWEQLSILGLKSGSIKDACNLIMELTGGSDAYSLLTETDASNSLGMYKAHAESDCFRPPPKVQLPSTNPRRTREDVKQGKLIRSILEVVRRMDFPPELKADDLTRLFIKILRKDVDEKWLLNFAFEKVLHSSANKPKLDLLFPDSGTECSDKRMRRSFDNLISSLMGTMHALIRSKVLDAAEPLSQVFDNTYGISVEVIDLIYVAEIRRLAIGNRFIRRDHLLYAFHELGYGLPEPLRCNMTYVPYNNHPPYQFYMASLKMAEYFADQVRLENFLFGLIYPDMIGFLLRGNQDKVIVMQQYQQFLKVLRRFKSNPSDLEGPTFIQDYSEIFQDINLEFRC